MNHSTKGLKLLLVFLIALGTLCILFTMGFGNMVVSGATITVDDDGPADYNNIQAAIDVAIEGDTISIEGGFYEGFNVSKNIHIEGASWDTTIVEGFGNENSTILITADYVNLSGLAIVDFETGITVIANGTTVHNTTFHSNVWGLHIQGSEDFDVTRNNVNNNIFYDNPRGVFLNSYSDNTTLNNNTMSNGNEGLYLNGTEWNNITWNSIDHNIAYGYGSFNSHSNLIDNNSIVANGYGVYLISSQENDLVNNSIVKNTFGMHLDRGPWGDSDDNTAHYNYFSQNSDYALDVDYTTIDATMNWWGDGSGPYHPDDNPDGLGGEVSDDVFFDPWIDELQSRAVIISISPNPADDEVKVRGEALALGNEVNRYVWTSSIDGEFFGGPGNTFNNDALSTGIHTVTLKVRQKSGNVWSSEVYATLMIHERPMPTIDEVDPTEGLDTDFINFTGSGTDDGRVEHFAWRSSIDDEFYNGTEALISYDSLSNGSHLIYFKVQDNYGSWSDEVVANLKIQGRPVGHIDDMSPNPALEGEDVTIRGQGTDDGTIERIIWSSSIDGTLDDGKNEVLIRDDLSLGEHIISILVQDDKGVWSYEVSSLLVITLQPDAFIDIIDPSPALDTDSIHFEGHGFDGDGTIELYQWRSDLDGILYTGIDSSFDYSDLQNGSHSISLRVRDNYDVWSDEVSNSLTVYGKPRARIASIFPNPVIITNDAFFRGTGSDEGSIEQYAWRSSIDGEFYNGTASELYYSGLSLGSHIIYFKIKDNDNIWSDEVARSLVVTEIPVASIDEVSPNPAFDTDTIDFTGSGTDDGTITQYAWSSDLDGEFHNNSEAAFDHRGLRNGSHFITLQVMDDLGFWSQPVNTTLVIYGRPQAVIDRLTPTPAGFMQNVTFSGIGSDDGSIIRYVWRSSIDGEFYNGSESEFVDNALTRGHHTIYFRVQDDLGFWSWEVSTTHIVSDIPIASIESIDPNPALHVETIQCIGNATDNGNIEKYVWRSSLQGEFYNGTETNITPFQISEGFEGFNVSYDSGGYVNWIQTNSTAYEGSMSARSGEIDDDEFSWMQTTFTWPGTLEFYWKVSSEESDYLKLIVDGKLEDQISGDVDWTKYSITLGEGTHTVRWSYEKDLHQSFGDDVGYVDGIRYTSDLTLRNGTHTIFFKVLDNEGFWSPEVSSLLLINGLPIIANMEINPSPAYHDETITFNATAYDDGNITEYVWWSDLDGKIYNGTESEFTIDDLSNGTHAITLRVRDDYGTWSELIEDEIWIRGKPYAYIENVTPEFTLQWEQIDFSGYGTDNNGIALYVWTSNIDGELHNASGANFSATILSPGIHTISFRVKDTKGFWSDTVTTEIIVNRRPSASFNTMAPNPAIFEEDIQFLVTGFDDGTIVRYYLRSSRDGVFHDGIAQSFTVSNLSLGTHVIYLKVEDNYGTWSFEIGRSLTVTEQPEASIDYVAPGSALHTDRIFFQGRGSDDNSVVWYEWTSSIQGVIYSGNQSKFNSTDIVNGTHTIRFRVRDNHNFWSEYQESTLDINGIPYANITYVSATFVTDRDTVDFQGDELDDDPIEQYEWTSSQDGIISNEKSFSTSDLSNGTHRISFRVKDDHDLWSEPNNATVTVNGIPSGEITGMLSMHPNEGDLVWFYANASDDGPIQEYQWWSDLDGLIGTSLIFSYSGLSNGTHAITFMVRDAYDQWSDDAVDFITVNGRPRAIIADVSAGILTPATEGEEVWFTGDGSDDGSIVGYRWSSSFDDSISQDQVFGFSTIPNGTHIMYLEVADDAGIWSEKDSIIIRVNGIPRVSIDSISPNPGVETRKVSFHAGIDDDGTIWEYDWQSSIDGKMESSKSFSRTNLSVGTHTITLKVRDNYNIWSTEVSTTLIIHPLPEPIIVSILPRASNSGDEISFFGRGTVDNGNIIDFWWRSSQNDYLSDQSEFQTSSLSNGTHIIEFKVMDDKGIWSDTATTTIEINGLPKAEIINVTATEVNEGDTVSFKAAGTDDGTVTKYIWSSSLDGTLYDGPDFNFTSDELDNGTHIITCKVVDDNGAVSPEVTFTIRVNGIPRATIDQITKNPAIEGEKVFFRAGGDDDGTIVRYVWISSLDQQIYDGEDPEFRIETLSLGNHTIILKILDDDGVWSEEKRGYLLVEKEDEEGMPWILIGGGLALIVIILVFVILFVIKPSGKEDQPDTTPGVPGQPGQAPPMGVPGQAPQSGPTQPGMAGPIPGSQFPGPVPPDQMAPDQMPPGQIPPGQIPPGQVQAGQMPQGQIPPGQIPPGQVQAGQMGAVQPPIPGISPQISGGQPPVMGGPIPPVGPPGQMPPPQQQPAGAQAGAQGMSTVPPPMAPVPGTVPQQPPAGQGIQQTQSPPQAPQPSNVWFCPSCGSEVANKFVFCTKCGFKRGS